MYAHKELTTREYAALRIYGMLTASYHSLANLGSWLITAYRRQVQRAQLRTMSDRMLQDIGLTRTQAELEAEKPFWRK